jgi:hypothetical protein
MYSIPLCLGHPSCLFPSGFLTNNLYMFLLSHIRATCPAQLILLDLIIVVKLGEVCKLQTALGNFLHTPFNFSPLFFKYFGIIFSNTLSLCSFLYVGDQVLHPYRTTGKIIVSFILISIIFDSTREDRRF